MSKAAVKKGADKTKVPASQTPVIAHEIVPGKFTDNDCSRPYNTACMINYWNTMVERDSSDEFILDIIDEVLGSTMEVIHHNYIQRQLLPFTITQARDAIVEIIEWQFLSKDDGEVTIDSDIGWVEDEEPEPASTDCWAQGSVPINPVQAPTPQLEVIEELPEQEEIVEQQETAELVSQDPVELPDVVSDTEEAPPTKEVTEEVKKESPPPKKKPFKPYRGKLKSAGVSKMTESLEESEMNLIYNEVVTSMPQSDDRPSTLLNMPASCTSILKVQSGRPPGNKDVVYDELGNVVAVMKLDPEKLPTHKVTVKYHVVDPAVEAAQARLDAMRKGKSTTKVKHKRGVKSIESLQPGGNRKHSKTSHKIAPLPPPLIEEMEVSHGVVVKEGGRVKKGPGRYYRKVENLEDNFKTLQPVAVRVNSSNITVSDLLDRHTPILRPIGETGALPLPPIMPHPPSQQV